MDQYGWMQVAAGSPVLELANPAFNADRIIEMIQQADALGAAVLVLPELAVTGYSCGDLFLQDALLDEALRALDIIARAGSQWAVHVVAGVPIRYGGRLFNGAALLSDGQVQGIALKQQLTRDEKRWFASAALIPDHAVLRLFGREIPIGDLLFDIGGVMMGVAIGQERYHPIPYSGKLAACGALLVANPSAYGECVMGAQRVQSWIENQSAACVCAYIHASAGLGESSDEVVYGGRCMIAEDGQILTASQGFERGRMLCSTIDAQQLQHDRITQRFAAQDVPQARIISLSQRSDALQHERRGVHATPFVPGDPQQLEERCTQVLAIQTQALRHRLQAAKAKSAVIGVSGGLDSTLALLVAADAVKASGWSPTQLIGVTMPGFGTTDKTYANALALIDILKATRLEIDIKKACMQHFSDIGQDAQLHDITYENAQARERTQVLMDLANQQGGLVVGTGDMSELALGWCTFGGDHLSMYGVNMGVPKTLIRHLIAHYACRDDQLGQVLGRVLDTPISPELLPPDAQGNISQITEDTLGPYLLHDFFLYHTLRWGTPPEKLRYLAIKAFKGQFTPQVVTQWLRAFYERFFAQQFKRSCLPNGPKVGSVSLSPRMDWRMPTDASAASWIARLDHAAEEKKEE